MEKNVNDIRDKEMKRKAMPVYQNGPYFLSNTLEVLKNKGLFPEMRKVLGSLELMET
jgi:hypothetical protein